MVWLKGRKVSTDLTKKKEAEDLKEFRRERKEIEEPGQGFL